MPVPALYAGYWCCVFPFLWLALLQQLQRLAAHKEGHHMKSFLLMILAFAAGILLIAHRTSYGLVAAFFCFMVGLYLLSLFIRAVKEWWAES